ncbi:MAG TPA: tRNA-dihydrouridine synthase family protein [Candidatus Paceibacterota bacterium]
MVNLGFWKGIHERARSENRPLFVLAPMADVTDCSFRHVISKYGKPDVVWTEFVAADGIVRATPEGKAKLMRDLIYNIESPDFALVGAGKTVSERPVVAQLFSSNPEYMEQACKLVAELGYDGVDINMGCPDKSIEKQGCGSAMIKTPKRAQEVIRAAQKGAVRAPKAEFGDSAELIKRYEAGDETALVHLPITVKTRIGYNKNELETWLPALLEAEPAVVTIHARTRKEMSKVPARWEHIARAVEIRDEFFDKKFAEQKANGEVVDETARTLIFGNGDVQTVAEGVQKYDETKAEGIMIGRGIFGNPWLFESIRRPGYEAVIPTVEEKLRVMLEHTYLYEKHLGDIKSFAVMKKHYKAYVNGFDGAKELRLELMEKADGFDQVREIVERFLAAA